MPHHLRRRRYESKGQTAETSYADTLGHHLVEAHWKYFTIDVKDAYECDRKAKAHYEFLLNRCSPKHYLPVMSVFRPNKQAKELTTHIYPKPNVPQPGDKFRWEQTATTARTMYTLYVHWRKIELAVRVHVVGGISLKLYTLSKTKLICQKNWLS